MNFFLEHTEYMENKNCIIEIYSECCICLDYLNVDFSKLDCCNNTIHTKCIYDMFVHVDVNENEKVIFTCPLCRKKDNFKNMISFKSIKKYTNDYDIINKYEKDKFYKYIELCKLYSTNLVFICFLVIIIYIFIKFTVS